MPRNDNSLRQLAVELLEFVDDVVDSTAHSAVKRRVDSGKAERLVAWSTHGPYSFIE
jgi:hypothetical protein